MAENTGVGESAEGGTGYWRKLYTREIHKLGSTKNNRDNEMKVGETCKECGVDRAYKLWQQCRKRETI